MDENYPQKLLVDGKNDQHVVWNLCKRLSLNQNFDVIDCENIDKLFTQIPPRFKQSGIKTIGIILDADENIDSR
jgi:hypothetical protein